MLCSLSSTGRCAIFFGKLSIVQQQFFIPLHSTIYYCTIIYSNAIVLLIKYKRHSQIKNNQIFVQSTGATIEKLYSGNSIRRIQSRVFFFSLFQFNAIDDDNNNNNLTTITANSQPCNFIFILIFVIATVVGARCMVIKQTGRNQQNIAPLLIYIYIWCQQRYAILSESKKLCISILYSKIKQIFGEFRHII